jgi:hypothetical protein
MPASQAAAYIAAQPNFYSRCGLMAMQYSLNVVFQESTGTTNHASRLSFATKVVNGSISPILLANVVLTDTGIQAVAVADIDNLGAAVPDTGAGSIDGRLQAMWDFLSAALG